MQPVRRRIVEILKAQGTSTVAELAAQLDMAQVSVRHHLDILMGEDLVASAGVRRRDGAGRPSQMYALTADAVKLFPQRHTELALGMLTELKTVMPAQELRELLLRLADQTAQEAPAPVTHQSVEERLDAVAAFLTQKGYIASWEAQDGRYVLHACNCPFTGVADHHPELCNMDQAMIQQLMPGMVRIQSRVLDGASHCRYAVATAVVAEPLASPPHAEQRGA